MTASCQPIAGCWSAHAIAAIGPSLRRGTLPAPMFLIFHRAPADHVAARSCASSPDVAGHLVADGRFPLYRE
ncbi:hypothetical protein CFBP2533_19950 [Xanthomonas hortorum pv. pelargonii]|uniref:Uncharacterized protein n=1 Tax=Xanthomonas hortorum pv. pelargonii TaxID=453602 RepID=A0A6V7D3T0_9XANT|nr:hypothetical protein CFBP2533_19950 [Xanthomonas hortorum pv. pelargonii]CAD0327772.1 hypothetical protein CFBP2533_19950 [Xanthomonas hortorum pv. pelargonii]